MSQDARFSDKQRALLRALPVPSVYRASLSVADLQRVQLGVLSPWIHAAVAAVLGFEDDVVSSLVVNTLQQHRSSRQPLDPRELQLTLTGFLEQAAAPFVEALWQLLLSAAKEKSGIPPQLVDSSTEDSRQQQSSQSALSGPSARSSVSPSVSVQPPASAPLPSVPSVTVSVSSSVADRSSRPHRAKSRFGPPLTATQKAAAAAAAVAAHTTNQSSNAIDSGGVEGSAVTGSTPAAKRQRVAR